MLLILTLIRRHLPRWVWFLALVAVFGAAAALYLHNVIFPLDRIGSLENDPAQMVWNLWITGWNATHHRSMFLTDMAYWPVGTNLAHHSLASGYIIFTWPLALLETAGVREYIIAYNLLIWISAVGLLTFSYLAVRELECPPIPALGAAAAVAFSSFFRANAVNLNHVSGFTVICATWLLLRWWRRQSRGAFFALAVVVGICFYFTELIAYWLMAVSLAATVLLSTGSGRAALSSHWRSLGPWRVLFGSGLTAGVAAPFLRAFATTRLPAYDLSEHSRYSANLLGFIVPDRYMTPLYASTFDWANLHVTLGVNGFRVFLGFPLLLAGIAGLWVMPRLARCLAGVVGMAFVVLALGPRLKIGDVSWDFSMPYAWIMDWPPLVGSRTPARLVVVVIVLLALCGAYFWRWLATRPCPVLWQQAVRLGVVVAWPVWVSAEAYSVAGLKPAGDIPAELPEMHSGTVLQLPLDMINGFVGLAQIRHRRPTLTGTVVRISPEMGAQWGLLEEALDNGGAALDRLLKDWNVRLFVFPPHFAYDRRSELQLQRALERPDIPLVDSRAAPWILSGSANEAIDRDLARTYVELAKQQTCVLYNTANRRATQMEIAGTAGREVLLRFIKDQSVIAEKLVAFSTVPGAPVTVRLITLDPPLATAGFDHVQITSVDPAGCRIAYLHFRDASP